MKSYLKIVIPYLIRNSLLILFLCFTQFSYGQNDRQKTLSTAFEKCYQGNIKTLVKNNIWRPKENIFDGERMNELYEKFLMEKEMLASIDKESYITLLGNTRKGISNEFSEKMRFNTEGFFPSWTILRCHDELYRSNTLLESDWQFKYAVLIARFQAEGELDHLKNAIEMIPDSDFKKIYYRHDVLNLVYALNYKMP